MRFPDTKIGEIVTQAQHWTSEKLHDLEVKPKADTPPAKAEAPPKIPLPPPVRPRMILRKGIK